MSNNTDAAGGELPRAERDFFLSGDEAETLRDAIGDGEPQAMRLQIGGGHSGFGLYASAAEYPEEGAVLVTTLSAGAQPAAQKYDTLQFSNLSNQAHGFGQPAAQEPVSAEQLSDLVADASIDANLPPGWVLRHAKELNAFARKLLERSASPHPAPQQPDARDALVRELVEAPTPTVRLGPEAFRFASFQEWVNKAQSWFRNRIPEPARSQRRYVAIDATGRVCLIGADFMRARDEDSFPVTVFLIDAPLSKAKESTS